MTYDGGQSWQNYFTDNNDVFAFKNIADLACCEDPLSNKKYLFAATGDGDHYFAYSTGVYRIELGTDQWESVNDGLFEIYQDFNRISKILVHPTAPNIMVGSKNSFFYFFQTQNRTHLNLC